MSSIPCLAILLLVAAACSKKEAKPPPEPVPPAPTPADARAFVGCPYEIWPSHLEPLADGTISIAPQRTIGADAPQHAPPQILSADGTTRPAGAGRIGGAIGSGSSVTMAARSVSTTATARRATAWPSSSTASSRRSAVTSPPRSIRRVATSP